MGFFMRSHQISMVLLHPVLLQLVNQRAEADLQQLGRLGTVAAGLLQRPLDQFALHELAIANQPTQAFAQLYLSAHQATPSGGREHHTCMARKPH